MPWGLQSMGVCVARKGAKTTLHAGIALKNLVQGNIWEKGKTRSTQFEKYDVIYVERIPQNETICL